METVIWRDIGSKVKYDGSVEYPFTDREYEIEVEHSVGRHENAEKEVEDAESPTT